LIAGDIEEVLLLDDADGLNNAYPVTEDGKVRLNPERLRARHDAQVKTVLAKARKMEWDSVSASHLATKCETNEQAYPQQNT
jgi:hypothetical protein